MEQFIFLDCKCCLLCIEAPTSKDPLHWQACRSWIRLSVPVTIHVQYWTSKACLFWGREYSNFVHDGNISVHKCWETLIYYISKRLAQVDHFKTQYLPFWASKFWQSPKQLAKNAEKCTIDSFCKSEDDPTKMDNFHKLLWYRENIYLNYSS